MNSEGTLGQAIRIARKNNGLTQTELGEKVDITHAFLSRIENNKVKPNDELLQKIAYALDYNDANDYLNEFRVLAGTYDNIDEDSEVFKTLKTSGRLELNKYAKDEMATKRIVDKPFYKLNYLFESDYRVFYDIKTEEYGEKIATVEVPSHVLHEIYKEINLKIIDVLKNYPILLNSIDDEKVIEKYDNEKFEKKQEFINMATKLDLSDSLIRLITDINSDIDLI